MNAVTAQTPDDAHEAVMDAVLEQMLDEPNRDKKRLLWRAYAKLHAMRSHAVVRRMEQERGIAR
jgi:hypothetical protein